MDDPTAAQDLLATTRRHLTIAIVFLFVGPVIALFVGVFALLTVADSLGIGVGVGVALAVGACAGLPGILAGRKALAAVDAAQLATGAPDEGQDAAAGPHDFRAKARTRARITLGLGIATALVGALGPLAGFVVMVAGMGAPGRPLRRRGRRVLPETRADAAWCEASRSVPALPEAERARRARRWLDDARAEHASIASFCDVTLDLLAAGAPPSLVERALQAAIDEIAHARLAFEMASAFAGEPLSAGPLREAARGGTLRLAASSLVDGALSEGIAARDAADAARAADNAAERDALERIAVDEARHAALGRDIAAWALGRRGQALPDGCGPDGPSYTSSP